MSSSALRIRTEQAAAADAASAWSELTDEQRLQITQRRHLVDAWRRACNDYRSAGRTKGEATAMFLSLHPELSQRTLYRWDAARDDEDPTALLDRRRLAHPQREEENGRIGELAWRCFKEVYLTIEARTVSVCYQIVAHQAGQHAGDPAWAWQASLRTVQARAARIPSFFSDRFRLSEREWKRLHEPSIPRDYPDYRSGEMWVGDFHQMDVFCRRSDGDPSIVRPLLSAWLDLRSRMVPGWYLTERECSDSVLLALRDGVLQYGPPWQLTIDNGKPYRCDGFSGGRPVSRQFKKVEDEQHVQSVCAGLNIAPHFSIPYNPNSKPIERWFGTLEQQFGSTCPGYCGSDPKSDLFKLAHRQAEEHPERLYTVARLGELLAGFIDGYQRTPHTGEFMDDLPPLVAFERFDPIPRAVAAPGLLDLLLMRGTEPVAVTKDGVMYQGVRYGSTDPELQVRHGQKVTLRVDPRDASYVVVCELDGRPICRATNNRLALAGATRDDVAEGMKAKARARRLAKQIKDGGAVPLLQDVTTAAIAARQSAGNAAMQKIMAATGTGDPSPRNLAPLRSDLAESFESFQRRIDRPPADPPRRSLEALAAAIQQREEPRPSRPRRDLDEILGDGGAA